MSLHNKVRLARERIGVEFRIVQLKIKARKLLNQYYSFGGDCGKELTEYIDPELAIVRVQFNEVMDELATIDPECPKKRL